MIGSNLPYFIKEVDCEIIITDSSHPIIDEHFIRHGIKIQSHWVTKHDLVIINIVSK